MLEEVFKQICASNGTDPRSPAAIRLAKALFAAFDHGIREREGLLAIVAIDGRLDRCGSALMLPDSSPGMEPSAEAGVIARRQV